jgi:hypothetical protein
MLLGARRAFVLGVAACSVPTRTETPDELTPTSHLGQSCPFGYPARTGATVMTDLRAVAVRCHCKYVTTTLGVPSCESSYDIGNENPDVCDDDPVAINDIDVHSGRGDCATSIARDRDDSSVAHLSFRCPIGGVAGFTLHGHTDHGETWRTMFLQLTATGRCP